MDRVTVALCTWNRAKLLDQTLTQMHALRIPTDVEWELLVVNNNCTDETDAVIARHQNDLPIRRLFEPVPGVSHAKNRAMEVARGELMLWTDDDVLVDPGWLAAYREAAARWPEAGYFGGMIEPWFEVSPPGWILENVQRLQGMLVVRNLGSEERFFSETEFPFGANMAFRTEALRTCRFDPNLGRAGKSEIRGEETALVRDLRSKGFRGVWVPGARVSHFVTRERLTRRYVWSYYHGNTGPRVSRLSVPRRACAAAGISAHR